MKCHLKIHQLKIQSKEGKATNKFSLFNTTHADIHREKKQAKGLRKSGFKRKKKHKEI